jgi:maltose operon periplasmic protein
LRNTVLIGFVALLVGCATPMESQKSSLQTQMVCCTTLSDLTFKPLNLDDDLTFTIASGSPVFEFPTGKSYVSAFVLPKAASRGIRVSSFFNGIMIGQYFQPIFLFLDDQKKPLASATPNLRFLPVGLTTNAQMIGGVRVPDTAEYLVIYTRDFSDKKVTAVIPGSPSVFMAGATPILVQNPATGKDLELSPTGELRLRAEKIPPQ